MPSESGSEPPSPPGGGAFAKVKLDGLGRGLRMIEKGIQMRTWWKHLPYEGKPSDYPVIFRSPLVFPVKKNLV
jgi:hypothetical protein